MNTNSPTAKKKLPTMKKTYASRSTAATTKMLTVCKRCGKRNRNGYQYCTACHEAHKRKSGSQIAPSINVASAATPSAKKHKDVLSQIVDIDEVRRVAGIEL